MNSINTCLAKEEIRGFFRNKTNGELLASMNELTTASLYWICEKIALQAGDDEMCHSAVTIASAKISLIMRKLELTLNLINNFTVGGFTYPVIKGNFEVGTCRLNSKNDQIIGSFSLKQDVEKEQYLTYNSKIIDGNRWLVNIEFSDVETSRSVQCILPGQLAT